MPAVITTQRTALTHDLAHLIQLLNVTGVSVTSIANVLREMKAHRFDRVRAAYYGWQVLQSAQHDDVLHRAPARLAGQQSLLDAFARATPAAAPALPAARAPPMLLDEERYGLFSPGDTLIRSFVVDVGRSKEDYHTSWRQQWVGGTIIQGDHTLKVGKGCHVGGVKVVNKRATFWSSCLNAPLLCLNVESTSFDDGGMALATKVLMGPHVYGDGRAPITLAYIDNPHRDEKGLIRRIPTLARPDVM
jgi:hypothetical protein